jgi:hypothetical protein
MVTLNISTGVIGNSSVFYNESFTVPKHAMHICIPHVDKKLGLEQNKAKQTKTPHAQGIKSKGVIFGFVHDEKKD